MKLTVAPNVAGNKVLQIVVASVVVLTGALADTASADAATCMRRPNCWYWPRHEGRIVRYYPEHRDARMRLLASRTRAWTNGGPRW